ncbi:hypothetical protein D1610_13235 [Sphingomonas gilva]|uniref:Uncharacterized protein n=1 Tax=Sphingomonas gilva TaxID=2305907 RepID=A0A396S134_9SPHN|nr:hypothetical protein [Sphingomonas gilva]RHW17075.1 hypothetical protein D1610_13235 [Sphingomonas gilva]
MHVLDERQKVSGFTELSEGSKAAHFGFDWERDYGGTYRQCPSAFWLAPDAADVLPPADLLHPRPAPPAAEPQPMIDPPDESVDNRAFGAGLAILLAGPIFVMSIPLVEGLAAPAIAFAMIAALPFTVVIGAILAAVPVCLGSLLMGKLGEAGRGWRHPLAWMGVGAPFGMVLAALFGSGPQGIGAMAITGALCAGVARWKVRWGTPAQPARNVRTPAVAISA